jgi:hypothetical protein
VLLWPVMAPGAPRGHRGGGPKVVGVGEEHRGLWCHGGLSVAAAMSCNEDLATSSWWIDFNDSGMVNSM